MTGNSEKRYFPHQTWQNLLDNHHPEAAPSLFLATQPTEVQRSVYGKLTWSY